MYAATKSGLRAYFSSLSTELCDRCVGEGVCLVGVVWGGWVTVWPAAGSVFSGMPTFAQCKCLFVPVPLLLLVSVLEAALPTEQCCYAVATLRWAAGAWGPPCAARAPWPPGWMESLASCRAPTASSPWCGGGGCVGRCGC